MHRAYTENMSQVKLTIFEVDVKGYHECSFAVSVGTRRGTKTTEVSYGIYNANWCLCFGPRLTKL